MLYITRPGFWGANIHKFIIRNHLRTTSGQVGPKSLTRTGGDNIKVKSDKRRRKISIQAWVDDAEYELIQQRMAEVGTANLSAFIRKQALNGYVLHVDLSPVKELVSLQRRCSNNLNQVAIHANTYGIQPHEINALQKDYEALWKPLSDLLKQLAAITAM